MRPKKQETGRARDTVVVDGNKTEELSRGSQAYRSVIVRF